MVDLTFVIYFFNAEKFQLEMPVEEKLNCNKYIHFLIIPMGKILIYERLFFELFIAIVVKDKKSTL